MLCYRESHHTNNTICCFLHTDNSSLSIGATAPLTYSNMSSTITACKFVGTVSLGLLTVRLIANSTELQLQLQACMYS